MGTCRMMNSGDLPDHIDQEIRQTVEELIKLLAKKHISVSFAALSAVIGLYVKAMPKELQKRAMVDIPTVIQRTIDEDD